MPTLDEAIENIRAGNTAQARGTLEELLDIDENDEEVWLWLSSVVEAEEDREICLENVLALNPNNAVALRGLEALRSGAFDTDDLLAELLQDEDRIVDPPATFIEDFTLSDEDEDFLFAEAGQPAKKKFAASKFHVIVIGVLVLLLVGVMAALGAAAMFLMDDGGGNGILPGQGASGQETPVEGQPTLTPTQTPMPTQTPTPSLTPTPTSTPLQLPTSKPTNLPTPTATRVVSPTPNR